MGSLGANNFGHPKAHDEQLVRLASAVRCLLVAYGLRQLIRTDELAPLAMAHDQV